MRWFMVAAIVSLMAASCAAPTATPTPTPTMTPTPTPSPTPSPTQSPIGREQAIEIASSYFLMPPEVVARAEVSARLEGKVWEVSFDKVNVSNEELPWPSEGLGPPRVYRTLIIKVDAQTGEVTGRIAIGLPEETRTPTMTSTPTSGPIPTAIPTPTAAPSAGADVADTLRELALAYWEAFNSYDADKALGYLEEAYRQERESVIRKEIGQIKFFRVKLGVSEESPPQMAGPGEGEMFLTMKEPLGSRRIHMRFREVEGEWKITYAQEVE